MEIPMTEQTEPSAEPKPVRPAVQKLLPEEIGGVRGRSRRAMAIGNTKADVPIFKAGFGARAI
jgi:hypothetical protein